MDTSFTVTRHTTVSDSTGPDAGGLRDGKWSTLDGFSSLAKILLLMLLSGHEALAQTLADALSEPVGWQMRHFTTADGLPLGSVQAARTDAEGFLWLATNEGLVRFDGDRFVIHDVASHRQMGSNRIVELARGPQGRVYALTGAGRLLRAAGARVEPVPPDETAPGARVHELNEWPLCATLDSGLFCLGTDDGAFRVRARLPAAAGVRSAAPVPDSNATWLLAPGGDVWLHDGTIARRVLKGSRFATMTCDTAADVVALDARRLAVVNNGVPALVDISGRVRWLSPSRHFTDDPGEVIGVRRGRGASLLMTTNRHVYRYLPESRAWRRLSDPDTPGVGRVWRGADGTLWYAQGRRLLRGDEAVLRANGTLLDLFVDDAGTIWISTRRDGLYVLSPRRVVAIDTASGLVSSNVYGIDLDPRGRLWLGSLGGGVQRVDLARGPPAARVFGKRDGLPGPNVWAVLAMPDDGVYAAPYAGGLLRAGPDAERFEAVSVPEPMAGARWQALTHAGGALWVGGSRGLWSLAEGGWRAHWRPGKRVGAIHSILHRGESVWLGTGQGLWRLRDELAEPVLVDRLGRIPVRSITVGADGIFWVATQGLGLVRVKALANGLEARRFTRADGLPSNSIHAIVEDSHGALWINSNQGIFRLRRDDVAAYMQGRVPGLTPLLLSRADGLPDLEGNGGVQPAAARDAAGRIWFPTQAGAVGIDPARFRPGRPPPVPVVDSLEVESHTWTPAAVGALPLGSRSPVLHFAAADLRSGAGLRFRYRLLPGDRRWRNANRDSSISLSQLAPGEYRFQLLAANGDGNWSPQPAELTFTVPPYWYETQAFRLGVVMAGLVLIAVAVHWRMRSLRSRAATLDREVEQRTRALNNEKHRLQQALNELEDAHGQLANAQRTIESRNRRLQDQADRLARIDGFRKRLLADVSHELRTPLMLIEMPLARLTGRSGRGLDGEIEIASQQVGRLRRLIDQLVTLVQAESGQLELTIARVDLIGLVASLRESWAVIGKAESVTIEFDAPDTAVEIYADRDQLESALGNLIDNAIKHSPSSGRVVLEVCADTGRGCARVEVKDSGPGFDAAMSQKLFERFCRGEEQPHQGRQGLGIGLALAREITELHGGRIGARPRARRGSCFWLELPLGSQHVALEELALADGADAGPGHEPGPTVRMADRDERIVLVEDHPDLAAYLGERLNDYAPVAVFPDADRALAALPDLDCGIVICDVMLPGTSGLGLAQRLRAEPRWQSLPILLISARATEVDRAAALEAGADDYLTKPFGFGELLERIAALWPAAAHFRQAADAPVEDPLLAVARERLADPAFGVAAWADAAHLSPRHLRRRLAELSSQAPRAWLREQRLLRVRALIESGECRTLAEAGERAGLDNPAYLYRLYRARFGSV